MMRGPIFTRRLATLGLLIATAALALAPQASAKFIRKPLGPFGSVEQRSFANPAGLAVDQEPENCTCSLAASRASC